MSPFLVFALCLGLVFAVDPRLNVESVEATSFITFFTPEAALQPHSCGWLPVNPAGEWLTMSLAQLSTVSSLVVQSSKLCTGVCITGAKLQVQTSLDTVVWVSAGIFDGPTDCTGELRLNFATPAIANFVRIGYVPCVCTQSEGASLASGCECGNDGGTWGGNDPPVQTYPCGLTEPTATPCSADSLLVLLANKKFEEMVASFAPACVAPGAQVINGTFCAVVCRTGSSATSSESGIICENGKWVFTPGCVNPWPVTPLLECKEEEHAAGQYIITPRLGLHGIVDGDKTNYAANDVRRRDHLHMQWIIDASYGVLGFSGPENPSNPRPADTVYVPTAQSSFFFGVDAGEHADEEVFITDVIHVRPHLDECDGYLEVDIPVGKLRDWGFELRHYATAGPSSSDLKGWYLEGQFYVNETRWTKVGDRFEVQRVDAIFPVRVKLADTFTAELECYLRVYGTYGPDVSVILFRESLWPVQELDVWYLVASPYPYMADYDGIFSSDHSVSDITQTTATSITIEPHRDSVHCGTLDTSTSAAHWCFQIIKVKYTHAGSCANAGPLGVTYTGDFRIYWNAACRDYPNAAAFDWCHIAEADKPAEATFPVVSNDICRWTDNYNPLKHIVTWMKPYQERLDTDDNCCGFVVDNIVWLKIWASDPAGWTNEFKVTKMRMMNLSIEIDSYTGPNYVIVYNAPSWTGDTLTNILFPTVCPTEYPECDAGIDYRLIECNDVDSAACKKDFYPMITVHLWLNAALLNLIKTTTPTVIKAKASMEVDYNWQTSANAHLQGVETFSLTADTYFTVGDPLVRPVSAALGSSANVAGIAAGAGCAVLAVAGVVAFFVHRARKNAANAPKKLVETSA